MFKLGIGNELRISYKWLDFGLKGQRSTLGLGNSNTAWVRTLWVPSSSFFYWLTLIRINKNNASKLWMMGVMWCIRTAVGVGVGVASSVAAVVALAWVRLRRCGRSSFDAQQQQLQEMEWDNSSFNITVNPLDRDVRLHSYLLIPSSIDKLLKCIRGSTVLH